MRRSAKARAGLGPRLNRVKQKLVLDRLFLDDDLREIFEMNEEEVREELARMGMEYEPLPDRVLEEIERVRSEEPTISLSPAGMPARPGTDEQGQTGLGDFEIDAETYPASGVSEVDAEICSTTRRDSGAGRRNPNLFVVETHHT